MFDILDLNKYNSVKDLLKQTIADEQDATRLASQSAMNVCKALVSIIILDARCLTRDCLPSKKETREIVFNYLPSKETKCQANYNKASVISYMLDAKKASFIKLLSKTHEYSQTEIMIKVFGILASYNGVNEVLRKIKDARKPKESKQEQEKPLVTIDFDDSLSLDDRIGILFDKTCEYIKTLDNRNKNKRIKALTKRLESMVSTKAQAKKQAKKQVSKKAA